MVLPFSESVVSALGPMGVRSGFPVGSLQARRSAIAKPGIPGVHGLPLRAQAFDARPGHADAARCVDQGGAFLAARAVA